MKKQTLISLMILVLSLITVSIFAQTAADSTAASTISQSFGLNTTLVLTILGALSWVIGHFAIKSKWTSYTLWAEKIVYGIYTSLHWFNEKTNKGQTPKN